MAKRRSIEERLAEARERAEQSAAQEKKLEKQYKEKVRKERTHRLIEVGAIMEAIYRGPIDHDKQLLLESHMKKLEREEGFLTKMLDTNESEETGNW